MDVSFRHVKLDLQSELQLIQFVKLKFSKQGTEIILFLLSIQRCNISSIKKKHAEHVKTELILKSIGPPKLIFVCILSISFPQLCHILRLCKGEQLGCLHTALPCFGFLVIDVA